MINKLGFGFLRLPKRGEELDWDAINTMVDAFLESGGTFFDTCYTYLNGMSEVAIRKCVAERKTRDSFQLCDKLPGYLFKSYEDCQKYFDIELERCGVAFFDILMLHWLNDENFAIAEKYDEFRFLQEKKAQGLAKRIGFSYHGNAALLDEILTKHPEVDVVLMQLNYLDWESEGIQSRKCYETCLRHRKSVVVMEPVKGGTLANIPEEAEMKLRACHPDWTPSDWALRFVQSLPGVEICLSGMGTVEQVRSNIRPFAPLNEEEVELLTEVAELIRGKTAIGCTGCAYCVSHCPKQIPIPQYIKLYNEITRYPGDDWKIIPTYNQMALSASKASHCIGCHSCEKHCPQKLTIAEHMKTIAKVFEQSEETPMEYRQLPHGSKNEKFSVIGLGLGGIGTTPVDEIEAIIRKAIDHGINFFDMCTAGATYAPVGRAIAGRREQVFLQVHFGAVYDENGEYGWCRDFETIKKTFLWELEQLGTDYVDFGFLHCVDTDEDFDKLMEIGVLDYIKELKAQGIVRHIGFSSHTPSVANRIIDTGLIDMMMFSINPAYDFEKGDEYGIGSVKERFDLFQRCAKEGVGISVMKPFFAGQLLGAEHSPFGQALSHNQCLQYAIDRPGVLVVVPGVQTMEHLDQVLKFLTATEEEKDYSIIGTFTADTITGTCVYCNHCQPCPAGIDIGLVNKYYDLALAGDEIAANHYTKLGTKADACLQCGHCEDRCPFSVKQMSRMIAIYEYFSGR